MRFSFLRQSSLSPASQPSIVHTITIVLFRVYRIFLTKLGLPSIFIRELVGKPLGKVYHEPVSRFASQPAIIVYSKVYPTSRNLATTTISRVVSYTKTYTHIYTYLLRIYQSTTMVNSILNSPRAALILSTF